jgi:hypothetical protein
VHHGVFLGIFLYCQFLLFHLQNGDYFYLLQFVDIEDVVFAEWLLDEWRWWVASVIGFVVGGWFCLRGGDFDGLDGQFLPALLLLGLFGLFGLDVGLGAWHSQRVDITRWYKTIMMTECHSNRTNRRTAARHTRNPSYACIQLSGTITGALIYVLFQSLMCHISSLL